MEQEQNSIGGGNFRPEPVVPLRAIRAEEQRLFASLAEISRDIKSHLILIGELAARRVRVDTRAGRSPAQIAPNPELPGNS